MRWRKLSFGVRLPSWIARGGLSVRGGAASIRSRFGRVWPARAAEPDTRRWRAWSGFLPALRAEDVLLASVTFLLAISTVMIYSAGAFYHHLDGDSFHFLKRQILWLPIAILVGILFSSIDYRHYRRYYPWILALSVLLLALVLVPAVGRVVNNSRRWLSLGPRLQFQPSELAKLATVLFVSGFLANQPERSRRFLTGFLPLCLAVFLVFGLIILEPDLGSSVFVLGLAVGLMLIAGVRLWYLLPGVFAIAPVLAFYVHDHWETVERRLLGFLRPEDPEQHQVYHSLIALGSGSWFGVGLGGSTEKLRYLPEAHTDFIFSIIGEELGFTGCMAILLLFLALVWAGVTIAWRARDRFGFLVASGITMALGYQAAINVAVVTGSAPTKGMSLPLLSFGGSGLCVTLAQIGILLSIARVARTEPRPAELELGGSRSKRPARKSRRAKKASRKATRPRRPARPSRARRKETAPAMVTADGGSARSEPKSGAAREAAEPNASKGDAQETTPAVERAPWESPHAFVIRDSETDASIRSLDDESAEGDAGMRAPSSQRSIRRDDRHRDASDDAILDAFVDDDEAAADGQPTSHRGDDALDAIAEELDGDDSAALAREDEAAAADADLDELDALALSDDNDRGETHGRTAREPSAHPRAEALGQNEDDLDESEEVFGAGLEPLEKGGDIADGIADESESDLRLVPSTSEEEEDADIAPEAFPADESFHGARLLAVDVEAESRKAAGAEDEDEDGRAEDDADLEDDADEGAEDELDDDLEEDEEDEDLDELEDEDLEDELEEEEVEDDDEELLEDEEEYDDESDESEEDADEEELDEESDDDDSEDEEDELEEDWDGDEDGDEEDEDAEDDGLEDGHAARGELDERADEPRGERLVNEDGNASTSNGEASSAEDEPHDEDDEDADLEDVDDEEDDPDDRGELFGRRPDARSRKKEVTR